MSEAILMQIDLPAGPASLGPLPAGFEFQAFDPDRDPQTARDLLNLAYRRGGGEILPPEDWWIALRLDPEFDVDLCFVVMDTRTSRMAAFAQVWTSGFVKDIAVHPTLRRRGLGRALMGQIFKSLEARDVAVCRLKVRQDNPSGAVSFYQTIGMTPAE